MALALAAYRYGFPEHDASGSTMLGPVGRLLKSGLTKAGYELYRPTQFERSIMRSPFADWFSTDIELFAGLYKANRETLSRIPQWLRPEDLPNSLWRYGVPEQWDSGTQGLGNTGLNEIETEPTYSDLIAFIAHQTPDLRYLEIGVSAGKNFLQICENVPGEAFVGLDVERLNPVLAEAVGTFTEAPQGALQMVETLSGQSTQVTLTLSQAGKIAYLRGDQFNPQTWAVLRGQSFNFVFSDGVHSPKAVRQELFFLQQNGLIDTSGPFTMYWDDLVNVDMQSAFNDCAEELKSVFKGGRSGLHWIHGTYGSRRLNGLFTTI